MLFSFPGEDALTSIYTTLLMGHLTQGHVKFPPHCVKLAPNIISSALYLHGKISATFLPTAVKFHYIFNLRDLANIFQVS